MRRHSTTNTVEPKDPARPRRSVSRFTPTPEQVAIQLSEFAGLGIDVRAGKFARLSWPSKQSFLTTVTRALKLDALGYSLKPLGQMRYEVRGGATPYEYDDALESCTCPLHGVLGTCKHSIWAYLKLQAARELLQVTAPAAPVATAPRYATAPNPWAAPVNKSAAPVRLHELAGVGGGPAPEAKPHSFPKYGTPEWNARVGKEF